MASAGKAQDGRTIVPELRPSHPCCPSPTMVISSRPTFSSIGGRDMATIRPGRPFKLNFDPAKPYKGSVPPQNPVCIESSIKRQESPNTVARRITYTAARSSNTRRQASSTSRRSIWSGRKQTAGRRARRDEMSRGTGSAVRPIPTTGGKAVEGDPQAEGLDEDRLRPRSY